MYTYVLLALPFSGDESISNEIKGIFPSTNSTPTSGQSTPGHEDVLSKASRLITSLRSDPLSVAGKHSKQLKAKRKRQRAPEREYQKNLVILDYPGENPPEVQELHEYDKVYEGSLSFCATTTEEIRDEIAGLLRKKKSIFNNYENIHSCDFHFVRCVNRRVWVRDRELVHAGSTLKQVYPSGAVYVRLTKSFSSTKVLLQHNLLSISVGKFCM